MKNWVQLDGNSVINRLYQEQEPTQNTNFPWVESADPEVGPGWVYENGAFRKPVFIELQTLRHRITQSAMMARLQPELSAIEASTDAAVVSALQLLRRFDPVDLRAKYTLDAVAAFSGAGLLSDIRAAQVRDTLTISDEEYAGI